jgi:hypothetical protein
MAAERAHSRRSPSPRTGLGGYTTYGASGSSITTNPNGLGGWTTYGAGGSTTTTNPNGLGGYTTYGASGSTITTSPNGLGGWTTSYCSPSCFSKVTIAVDVNDFLVLRTKAARAPGYFVRQAWTFSRHARAGARRRPADASDPAQSPRPAVSAWTSTVLVAARLNSWTRSRAANAAAAAWCCGPLDF